MQRLVMKVIFGDVLVCCWMLSSSCIV